MVLSSPFLAGPVHRSAMPPPKDDLPSRVTEATESIWIVIDLEDQAAVGRRATESNAQVGGLAERRNRDSEERRGEQVSDRSATVHR